MYVCLPPKQSLVGLNRLICEKHLADVVFYTTAGMLLTYKRWACQRLTQISLYVLKEYPLSPLRDTTAIQHTCEVLAFRQLLLKLEVGSEHSQAKAIVILSVLSTL